MILFTGAVERIQIVSTILDKYDTGMRPQEPRGVADQVAHKLSLNRIVDLVSCLLFILKVKFIEKSSTFHMAFVHFTAFDWLPGRQKG